MARRLAAFVHVRNEDGVPQVFGPEDTVPTWAAKLITNPDAWDGPVGPEPGEPTVQAPPKGGRGSGFEAWRAYATTRGFAFEDDATRDDIIDALESDGIPTE